MLILKIHGSSGPVCLDCCSGVEDKLLGFGLSSVLWPVPSFSLPLIFLDWLAVWTFHSPLDFLVHLPCAAPAIWSRWAKSVFCCFPATGWVLVWAKPLATTPPLRFRFVFEIWWSQWLVLLIQLRGLSERSLALLQDPVSRHLRLVRQRHPTLWWNRCLLRFRRLVIRSSVLFLLVLTVCYNWQRSWEGTQFLQRAGFDGPSWQGCGQRQFLTGGFSRPTERSLFSFVPGSTWCSGARGSEPRWPFHQQLLTGGQWGALRTASLYPTPSLQRQRPRFTLRQQVSCSLKCSHDVSNYGRCRVGTLERFEFGRREGAIHFGLAFSGRGGRAKGGDGIRRYEAGRWPLPEGVLPAEDLQWANAAEVGGSVLGPSTTLRVSGVVSDGGVDALTGATMNVLVVDMDASVLSQMRVAGDVEDLATAFDPDDRFAIPSPDELLEWMSSSGLQALEANYTPEVTAAEAEEEVPLLAAAPKRQRRKPPGGATATGDGGPPKRATTATLAASMETVLQTLPVLTAQMQQLLTRQEDLETSMQRGVSSASVPTFGRSSGGFPFSDFGSRGKGCEGTAKNGSSSKEELSSGAARSGSTAGGRGVGVRQTSRRWQSLQNWRRLWWPSQWQSPTWWRRSQGALEIRWWIFRVSRHPPEEP